jgi:gamma-glutamylputrescine oxidase
MAASHPPSWYHLTAGDQPQFAPPGGSRKADVCIVGGGFTGLSAALHLAQAGADVVLVEADRIGYGASGRNGGQLHSGQRQDVLWLENKVGFEAARTFWDIGEMAKALVRALVEEHAIACDLTPGLIEAVHKPSWVEETAELVDALQTRYDYDQIALLDRDQTADALGSTLYAGGFRDNGAGHLDPYRFALGLAHAAKAAGASLHERTRAIMLRSGRTVVTTHGTISADHVILATDCRSGEIDKIGRRCALGINSFIVATEPLGDRGLDVLPGNECADDTRYIVRYWRKSADGRLIFGGGENNSGSIPSDIASVVRPHVEEIYPQLKGVEIAHGWSGLVTVTAPRMPFVREVQPGVWAAGGYSGQGVALAPYVGRLLAEQALSATGAGRNADGEALEQLALYTRLAIPQLADWTWLRRTMVTTALWQGRIRDRL